MFSNTSSFRGMESLEGRALFSVSVLPIETGDVSVAGTSVDTPVRIDAELIGRWSGQLVNGKEVVGQITLVIDEALSDGSVSATVTISTLRGKTVSAHAWGDYKPDKLALDIAWGETRDFSGTMTAEARPWKDAIDAKFAFVMDGEALGGTAALTRIDRSAGHTAAEVADRTESIFSQVLA